MLRDKLLSVLMAVAEQLGHGSLFVVIECNLLPYGTGICHYICVHIIFSHLKNYLCPFLLFLNVFLLSYINKSEGLVNVTDIS